MVSIKDDVLKKMLEEAFFEGYRCCSEIVKQSVSSSAYSATYVRIQKDFMEDAEKKVNANGENKWKGVDSFLKKEKYGDKDE